MLLYALVVFLSAFLLFLIQPLMGKVLLPWFGGGASIWSASMMFFQVLLLVGHTYSHWITEHFSRRKQTWIHLGVLGASVALVVVTAMGWGTPLMPGPEWQPQGADAPLRQILLILTVSVGLPYLVLSTTSPLLQRWAVHAASESDPYPLYALSNIGSMAALLAYPLVMQPAFSLPRQSWIWTAGYGLFAAGVGFVAWRQGRVVLKPAASDAGEMVRAPVEAPTWLQRGMWLLLSAMASVLLLATTNQMTQNIAAVPLLWVVPLALYLLTFVIAFSSKGGYSRWYLVLFLFATIVYRYALVRANTLPILVQLNVFALLLFAGAMVCHGEMVKLRPDPRHLTQFYLTLALGGALGGVLVNLAAPVVFNNTWELPLSVILSWVAVATALVLDGSSPLHGTLRLPTAGLLVVALVFSFNAYSTEARLFQASTVAAHRNFYGVLRVQAVERARSDIYRLVHGTTIHGVQYTEDALRDEPLGYFSPSSGIGMLLAGLQETGARYRVGVLGLGAGTLAAYGRDSDVYRFYEIDPQVIDYALGEGEYFTYLEESPAEIDVLVGDARLSLEQELRNGESQGYDVLVLDVFSGDAMPVHLLTREAFHVYFGHLDAGGILAANISTSHLNLRPLLAAFAAHFEMEGVVVEDAGDGGMRYPSFWVLMSRDPEALDGPMWAGYPALREFYDPEQRLWTDNYSNLFRLLAL